GAVVRSTPARCATVRTPTPASQARNSTRPSPTETSRDDTPTSTSHDLERSDSGPDQTPRHDTPSGPITGNRVVPCSWQKPAHNGPMNVAGDTRSSSARRSFRTASTYAGSETLPGPAGPFGQRAGSAGADRVTSTTCCGSGSRKRLVLQGQIAA